MNKKKVLVLSMSNGIYFDSSYLRLKNRLSGLSDNLEVHFVGIDSFEGKDRMVLDNCIGFNDEFLWLYKKLGSESLIIKIIAYISYNYIKYGTYFMGILRIKKYIKSCHIFTNEYDCVYTIGGPEYVHYLGHYLKARHGVRWIVDIGDPIYLASGGPRGKWVKRKLKFIDQMVCYEADMINVTTEATKDAYILRYGEVVDQKISVTPSYGISTEKFGFKTAVGNRMASLVYVGNAFPGDRDLTNVFKVINNLNNGVRLYVYGFIGSNYQKASNERIIINGRVDHYKALELHSLSSCNLVVGNKSILQIPAKIYILLGIPIPILYIVNTQTSSSDPVVSKFGELPGFYYCCNNTEEISEVLQFIELNYTQCLNDSELRLKFELVESISDESIRKQFYVNTYLSLP